MEADIEGNGHARGNGGHLLRGSLHLSNGKMATLGRNPLDLLRCLALVDDLQRNLIDPVDLVVDEGDSLRLSHKWTLPLFVWIQGYPSSLVESDWLSLVVESRVPQEVDSFIHVVNDFEILCFLTFIQALEISRFSFLGSAHCLRLPRHSRVLHLRPFLDLLIVSLGGQNGAGLGSPPSSFRHYI